MKIIPFSLSGKAIHLLKNRITAILKQFVKKPGADEHQVKHAAGEVEQQQEMNLLYAIKWIEMGSEPGRNNISGECFSKIAGGF